MADPDAVGPNAVLSIKFCRAGKVLSCATLFAFLICFVFVNTRHISAPFRGSSVSYYNEAYYAVLANNYLLHGYTGHWFGVYGNLNPEPDQFKFKNTEMPGFFIAASLGLRFLGGESLGYRLVELGYALLMFAFFSFGTWKLFDSRTALLASVVMLLLPINIYLLHMGWIILFPLAATFSYILWRRSHSWLCYLITISALTMGCLHHVYTFFIFPVIFFHALIEKDFRKHFLPLLGMLSTGLIVGLLYIVPNLLFNNSLEQVVDRALDRSILNVEPLAARLPNYWKVLSVKFGTYMTIPMLILSACWPVRVLASEDRRAPGSWLIFMLLLSPLMFYVIFLTMMTDHFHFFALLAPFLSLASSRILLDRKIFGGNRRHLQWFCIAFLICYLALMRYKTDQKHGRYAWSSSNGRGYTIATGLNKMMGKDESVAGYDVVGITSACMSPAFNFYLQRNYYGNVHDTDRLMELQKENNLAFFLFPSALVGREDGEWQALTDYLMKNYHHFSIPQARTTLIFDLRLPLSENENVFPHTGVFSTTIRDMRTVERLQDRKSGFPVGLIGREQPF